MTYKKKRLRFEKESYNSENLLNKKINEERREWRASNFRAAHVKKPDIQKGNLVADFSVKVNKEVSNSDLFNLPTTKLFIVTSATKGGGYQPPNI